ncbi:GGDEF domain-containing protein [Shewanella marisflavi]|uniref:Diguanylate cyclase DosC n=1 Tax=Shewanella marisflavi TaxID=260364 RepID=A0AAC9TVN4_9GAMM|nr:GGDEF domain-containing protein [Shewanella marisflavi]ASJ95111.1 GGDEF domain-containing protein [Shewanella marisflavi]
MNQTNQTLFEQMRITELEIEFRKSLFLLTTQDTKLLASCRPTIQLYINDIVEEFYSMQTDVSEIALLIGDSDTLERLRAAQKRYVQDLFLGEYDLEYVNNRLRIGLVHKRIGVEPKLYLSAVHTLKNLINKNINKAFKKDPAKAEAVILALDKLILFDVSLVFDTYIRSLVSEIETAKQKAETYANNMETKVKERTQQLEELSRTDPLTGLLNVRHLNEIVTRILRAAQRRLEPVSICYIDINDFKKINDTQGHQAGDNILQNIAKIIASAVRGEDCCFRYGGDEFCIVLPNCNATDVQSEFIIRLEKKLKQELVPVTLSYGIVDTGPQHYMEASEIINLADSKMYQHKRNLKSIPTSTDKKNLVKLDSIKR